MTINTTAAIGTASAATEEGDDFSLSHSSLLYESKKPKTLFPGVATTTVMPSTSQLHGAYWAIDIYVALIR